MLCPVYGTKHTEIRPMDGRAGVGAVFTGDARSNSTKKGLSVFCETALFRFDFLSY